MAVITNRELKAFLAIANKAREEHKKGKTLKFDSAADAQRWMDEL